MGPWRAGARIERNGGGGGREGRVLSRDAFGFAALHCDLISAVRQPARALRRSAARHPARVGAIRVGGLAPPHNARATHAAGGERDARDGRRLSRGGHCGGGNARHSRLGDQRIDGEACENCSGGGRENRIGQRNKQWRKWSAHWRRRESAGGGGAMAFRTLLADGDSERLAGEQNVANQVPLSRTHYSNDEFYSLYRIQ